MATRTSDAIETKTRMPQCPKCRHHETTTEHVTFIAADDGRGAQFKCRDCGETFRARGPYADAAALASPPAAIAKPSTPPPATSRTGAPRSSSSSSRDD
jgi:hypothetical protein